MCIRDRPGIGPDDRRQTIGSGAPLDLGNPRRSPLTRSLGLLRFPGLTRGYARVRGPGAAAVPLEQTAEQHRLPLGLAEARLGKHPAEPLRRQIRVRRTQVVIKNTSPVVRVMLSGAPRLALDLDPWVRHRLSVLPEPR